MARSDQIGAQLEAAFPGLRVTDTMRSQARQDQYVREGKTRSHNSQHITGDGLDVVLPRGVSSSQVRAWLGDKGIDPGEFLNESGSGSNQGTGAHLHIGLASKARPKGGDPASAGGGTSFDRAKASRQQSGPSMDAVFRAYQNTGKAGGMTPQEATQYEHAVNDGQIMLPRGGAIRTKPSVAVLPPSVVAAYNSHAMDDDPTSRKAIEDQVAQGNVRLPNGMRLQKPDPRTLGDRLKMGTRDIIEGVGSLPDIVAAPLNVTTNAVLGTNLDRHPFTSAARYAADSLGLPKPESDTEKLISATGQGAAQTVTTAGVGGLASKAGGVAGEVARAVSANPVLDAVSGAAGGYAQESARQSGAGVVGQIAAGLVGGATPVGLAGSVERMRAPKSVAEVVATTPREAVIDEAGNLTPHGQEVAARHDLTPEQVTQAYETPPRVQEATANDQLPEAAAREATNDAPVAEPAPTQEAPKVAPEAAPEPINAPTPNQPQEPDAMPATALERVQQGNEFGVSYTRGQATKSFDVQDREQRLKASNGPEGEAMRQFGATQADQVKAAVEDFKAATGKANMTPEERGNAVQDAVRELRDIGQAGVSALYKQARDLGSPVNLDTAGIKNTFEGLMAEAEIPDAVKKVLEAEAARYGLIGKPEPIGNTGKVTNEARVTTVKLDDGTRIKFRGEPQTLALDNAEEFRKVVTAQYLNDGPRHLTRELKTSIDDAVEQAVANTVKAGDPKVSDALKTAREAHIEQKQTFAAKDVVNDILDWKKGTATGKLSPEQVMARAFRSTSDLKRVKAVLLSSPTVKSKAAWKAIQAHGLAEVFSKATTRNVNIGGEITDAISGAKLRSAIVAFDPEKLKVLLDPEQFNTLMKLRRVIEDVTIPITGTTNPSGSGNLLMRLAKDADNQVTAAFAAAGAMVAGPPGAAVGGTIGRTIAPAIKGAKEAAQAGETLKGATEYTPAEAINDTGAKRPGMVGKAGGAVKSAGVSTLKAFIDIYGSPRVLAPVIAAGSESQ